MYCRGILRASGQRIIKKMANDEKIMKILERINSERYSDMLLFIEKIG